jgi:hypothetical protein
MVLEYDFFTQELNVTITHDVTDPNTHYIERVDILKNDVLFLTENYTSQPLTSTFTYTYDVEAADNDELEVTTTSSDTGNLTGQITVNEPSQEGVIDSGEYDFTATFSGGDFKLHWKVTGDTILMAMEGPTCISDGSQIRGLLKYVTAFPQAPSARIHRIQRSAEHRTYLAMAVRKTQGAL